VLLNLLIHETLRFFSVQFYSIVFPSVPKTGDRASQPKMDISGVVEYKFVQGPSRTQSGRIDPDLWELHKKTMIEKREELTLPELMLFMKQKHGFIAT
jgi:hypothetical protein